MPSSNHAKRRSGLLLGEEGRRVRCVCVRGHRSEVRRRSPHRPSKRENGYLTLASVSAPSLYFLTCAVPCRPRDRCEMGDGSFYVRVRAVPWGDQLCAADETTQRSAATDLSTESHVTQRYKDTKTQGAAESVMQPAATGGKSTSAANVAGHTRREEKRVQESEVCSTRGRRSI